MFNSLKVVPEYANLLGWEQFYDLAEINLPTSLTDTETGEYFQDVHSAMQLDVIQATLPNNYPIDTYLRKVITQSTNGMLNDILSFRQLREYGKTLLDKSLLLNRYGWANDSITNKSRFVGFQIRLMANSGLQAVIDQIGAQFTGAETFTMYLFHSSKSDSIKTFEMVTTGDNGWSWSSEGIELDAFLGEEYQGGVFVLGYYQDDITSNAINYSNFNWDKGECSTCSNQYATNWKNVNKYYNVYPLYVEQGNYTVNKMFNLEDADFPMDQSFGLNLKLTTRCDFTTFFIDNKFVFKKLLGLKVAIRVLNDMKNSQQINYVEENMKNMIIRDLEGDKDTNLKNLPTLYEEQIKAVSYNISSINDNCMTCKQKAYAPTYGMV